MGNKRKRSRRHGILAGRTPRAGQCVPKLLGADVEVGNFLAGVARPGGTGSEASRALLREFDGVPAKRWQPAPSPDPRVASGGRSWDGSHATGPADHLADDVPTADHAASREAVGTSSHTWDNSYRSYSGYSTAYPAASSSDLQDQGRTFLPGNGGCAYIDLDHLELALPETRSAFDHVACWHAMLRLTRQAMETANHGARARGERVAVLVNNSDGLGHSYGGHLNLLVTRRAWDNIFSRRLQYLLYLASFQASAIVITGQGKVGSENGRPPAPFQLSQRADFVETLVGPQTTYDRPLVNSRDEPLCGGRHAWGAHGADANHPGNHLARLHVIFFDSNLCHVACLLKAGMMQIVLAMIEAEQVDPHLFLEDPLDALVRWSRDPGLTSRARVASGRRYTAVELQRRYFEAAARFVEQGRCEGLVPEARRIVALWDDTLTLLEARDIDALAPRLDWALKLSMLERARARRPDLEWDAPELKQLDHMYASLDRSAGLYWAYERGGAVEQVVLESRIARFVSAPPEDTRAWTRAMLLRRADGDETLEEVDWDRMRWRGRDWWAPARTLDMSNPLALTRADAGPAFEAITGLDDLLDALGVAREPASSTTTTTTTTALAPTTPGHGCTKSPGF